MRQKAVGQSPTGAEPHGLGTDPSNQERRPPPRRFPPFFSR